MCCRPGYQRIGDQSLFGLPSPIKTMTRGDSSYVNDGLALEERCKTLLESHGYTVETTPRSNDGGIDLITKLVDHLGINQELLVQCKDYGRPVGVEVVRELIGVRPIDRQVILVLAAPSGVTATAEKQAGRGSVAIWDEETLSKLEEEGHLF